MSDWSAYTGAAARLGAVRAGERETSGGARRSTAAARRDITELSDKLADQQRVLTELARTLRYPAPSLVPSVLPPVPVGTIVAPADRIDRARSGLEAAAKAALEADAAGELPMLLPRSSPRLRNAAVYGGFAGAALVLQLVLVGLSSRGLAGPYTAAAWGCCGLPAIAFFAAYLTIGVVCRPRKSTESIDRNPRMGALISVAGLPLYTLLLVFLGSLF